MPDSINKALIATLIDYNEAGTDEPWLYGISSGKIFGVLHSFGQASTDRLSRAFHKENSPELSETSDLSRENRSLGDVITKAKEYASNALNIKSLETNIQNFSGFYALKGSIGMVLASGKADASVMVISEPPGRAEELESVPYAGEAGVLFRKIFSAVGLSIGGTKGAGIYVVPSIPFRLVKSSNREFSDLDLIKPFVKRHIELHAPKYIVLVGRIPIDILDLSEQFNGQGESKKIGSYNGTPVIEIEGINLMIKSPERKRKTWNNLKLLRKLMDKDKE